MTTTTPYLSPTYPGGPATLRDAVHRIDRALADPGDRDAAVDALSTLVTAIDEHDRGLLEEIHRAEPRLASRILALQEALTELADRARLLQRSLEHSSAPYPDDLRSALAELARRLRRHQCAESDIIFDALNTDLGAGD